MSDEEWIAELKKIAAEKFGFTDGALKSMDVEAWLEYRNFGFSPEEALYLDEDTEGG